MDTLVKIKRKSSWNMVIFRRRSKGILIMGVELAKRKKGIIKKGEREIRTLSLLIKAAIKPENESRKRRLPIN